MSNKLIGKSYTIKAGTRVTRAGSTSTRKTPSTVTIRRVEAKGNKTRVYWKSNGLTASATI